MVHVALKLYRKNDIKVFILFLLRNVGRPLDFTTVNDIVVQDEVVGYFDFAENFAELLETGNIAELRGPDGSRYQVTEQGIEVASSGNWGLRVESKLCALTSSFYEVGSLLKDVGQKSRAPSREDVSNLCLECLEKYC